ncbi:hypothetical protein WG68_08290 [Arsukibacterium ikkense]|uniref:DUF1488 domain-containing protein n=1 Tax=Arsukibacterium ikkense TaxID=336831 RepID=A0A0M2V8K4_9GAMM|nr:DUF1488 family protein [Arsukibacterium ikkense]KKO45990.1 hypothetical protein WG68_08290 [Arsukibacterium ikkense]
MNQQLIFNNDFQYDASRQAVRFSCLLAGLKVNCYIALPGNSEATQFLAAVTADAFSWEDRAEQAIANDNFNDAAEIWL